MHLLGPRTLRTRSIVTADRRPDPEAERDRLQILRTLEDWLETPLVVLGLVWLVILVAELLIGENEVLTTAAAFIWIVFIVDFLVRLILAPRKIAYFRQNWITAVALVLPAFRVLRIGRVIRALRAARGLQLARLLTSVNRGMGALSQTMERRGARYVVALTTVVIFTGAAGMYAFERSVPREGFDSYAESLWWTAMLLTTIGSEHWPATPEGRALALFLSIYALGVLGYITATLASFFVGRDAEAESGEVAGEAALESIRAELAGLRAEVRALRPPHAQ